MVIVSDSDDRRLTTYGATSGGPKYEKYRFGAAMYDIKPRADTGKVNQSPVATLPGDFLMQADCKNSYKVRYMLQSVACCYM